MGQVVPFSFGAKTSARTVPAESLAEAAGLLAIPPSIAVLAILRRSHAYDAEDRRRIAEERARLGPLSVAEALAMVEATEPDRIREFPYRSLALYEIVTGSRI